MTNNSSTGGYLDPAGAVPLDDQALVDFLQPIFAALSGIDGALVRPRFQVEPPNLPPRGATWMALGLGDQEEDAMGYVSHDPSGDGTDVLSTHETVEVLLSYYGPLARTAARQMTMGFQIAQNREIFTLNGMGLMRVGRMVQASELIKEQWLARTDVTVTIRREIGRVYPVLSLLSASGTIESDTGRLITFTVSPP